MESLDNKVVSEVWRQNRSMLLSWFSEMVDSAANTGDVFSELQAFVSLLQKSVDGADTRADGLLKNNLLKLGAGSSRDVENFNQPNFSAKSRLTKIQLEDITFQDEMCLRVATKMPSLMASGGIELKGLSAKQLKSFKKAVTKTKILKAFEQASVMANIYNRGAAIVLAVDDGCPWNEPVNKAQIKSVEVAFVQDGYKVTPDFTSGWLEPQYYQLAIGSITSEQESLIKKHLTSQGLSQVHSDRVLWFPGIWCPRDVEMRYQGSPSRVAMFWRAYSRYEMGLSIAVNLMARISIVVFKRKGLLAMLGAADAATEKKLLEEMDLVQKSLNNLGIVFADAENHQVEIISRSLAEVANLLGRLKQMAIAASGLTEVELFGQVETGGGLSNDDLRDRIIRANLVSTEQDSYWREPMETFCEYVLIAQNSGKEPDDWSLEFPSTLRLTPVEESQEFYQNVTLLSSLVGQSVHADEVRAYLAANPTFAPYIDLKTESPAQKAEREAAASIAESEEADPLAELEMHPG